MREVLLTFHSYFGSVFRVGTKGMTYAQQLRDYENEVLKKRYEELSAEELEALKDELDEE